MMPHDVRQDERGIALILTLLLVMAMSIVAAGLMSMAQTETYGTMNYRMMSQARYAAESGIHKAANYLLSDAYTTIMPGTASDPIAGYDLSVSPVKFNGADVVLSAVNSVTSNYPLDSVKSAFSTTGHGSMSVGLGSVSYAAYATLRSMQQLETGSTLQVWDITATGTFGGAKPATEEVRATLEIQLVPNHGYAAFATAATCGALTLKGGASTDSYDSSAYSGSGTPPVAANNGDMGTNGNLTETGTTTLVNGNLYTPRTGVGNCSSNNVDAQSVSGGATLTGTIVQLPQAWLPPAPNIVAVTAGTLDVTIGPSTTCANIAAALPTGAVCSGTAGDLKIDPQGHVIAWRSLSVGNAAHLTLFAGTYNLNTVDVSQNGTVLNIGDPTGQSPGVIHMTLVGTDAGKTLNVSSGSSLVVPSQKDNGYAVVIDVMTSNQGNNVPVNVDGGGGITNLSYDPQRFQIRYAGTNGSSVSGGGAAAFLINAPNAPLNLNGGSDFYGSLIVKTLNDTGGTHLHYDRNLASNFGIAGNPILSAFSWKRF
jgi:Tfp pilus assembly protein PilX